MSTLSQYQNNGVSLPEVVKKLAEIAGWKVMKVDKRLQMKIRKGKTYVIAAELLRRSQYDCANLWTSELDPSKKRGSMSKEEIALILQGIYDFGEDYIKITAEYLPDRANEAVRYRWKSMKSKVENLVLSQDQTSRKQLKAMQPNYKFVSYLQAKPGLSSTYFEQLAKDVLTFRFVLNQESIGDGDELKKMALSSANSVSIDLIGDLQETQNNFTSIILSDGSIMPQVGLGTWKSLNEGEVGNAVKYALKAGFRHLDCAWTYKNEKEIGVALSEIFAENEIKREDLFITSKLWNDFHEPLQVESALQESLRDLQVEYLDLYLMHWPVTGNEGEIVLPTIKSTWFAMEELVRKGLVKSIGVSNFSITKLLDLLSYSNIKPVVNQVELHPLWRQDKLVSKCHKLGVHVVAYSPLGSPDSAQKFNHEGQNVLSNSVIIEVASQVNKTPAQVCIRWAVQRGTSVIPKSANEHRIKQNYDVFSWNLTEEQMLRLSSIEPQTRMLIGKNFIKPMTGPYKNQETLWDYELDIKLI